MSRDRMDTVLRIRELRERQAMGALAEADREVRKAEGQVAQRRRAYWDRPVPPGAVDPLALRALQLQGLGAHDLLQDAIRACEVVEDRRDERRQEWSRASVGRKSVERLVERRSKEAAIAARAAADRALDEVVAMRRPRS